MFIQFPHFILKKISFCHLGSMGAAKSCPAYCQRLDVQVDQAAHFSDFSFNFLRPALQLQLPTKASSKHFLQKDGKLFADCVTKTQAAAFLRLKHISKHSNTKSCLESWDVYHPSLSSLRVEQLLATPAICLLVRWATKKVSIYTGQQSDSEGSCSILNNQFPQSISDKCTSMHHNHIDVLKSVVVFCTLVRFWH